MKKSEEILKRNITKFTEFEENDNPSIPYKDALKAVEQALQQAKNNKSLHDVSCCETCGKELTNIGGSQMYCHNCGTTKIGCN